MAHRTMLVLLLTVTAGGHLRAQGSFDPAARARAIAPFIDEQTIGLCRVDLRRVEWDAVWNDWLQWLPQAVSEPRSVRALKSDAEWLAGLGIPEFYVVASVADLPDGLLIVAPAPPGTEAANLDDRLADRRWEVRSRSGMLVVGPPRVLDRVARMAADPRPELAGAFEAAGDTSIQFILLPTARHRRVVEETLDRLPPQVDGGPITVVTRGVFWAALGVATPPRPALKLVIQSENAAAAAALNARWPDFVNLVPGRPELRNELVNLKPVLESDRLVLNVAGEDPRLRALNAALSGALGQLADARGQQQTANQLRQIAIAFHNWHDVYKSLPAQAICADDGTPRLSWRVMILPFMDGGLELYNQFHLDESWDSPHNRTLIEKMPDFYHSPASKLDRNLGKTNFLRPTGRQTLCDGATPIRFRDILDGTSNTMLVVEVDDELAVPWTRPDDWPYDPEHPMRGLGQLVPDTINAVFADGANRVIELPVPAEQMRAFMTRNGGEPVK